MAIEFDPDQLIMSVACGSDVGRGYKSIIDACVENPAIFKDITSLGTIYERAKDYFEHRSKTHYAEIGEEKITSDAGPYGHHTTSVGDRTTHTDANSYDTTALLRDLKNKHYHITTEEEMMVRVIVEIMNLTRYHTVLAEERIHIAAGEDVENDDTYEEIHGLFDGVEIKEGWHPEDRIIMSTHGIIKLLGQMKTVIWNMATRTCPLPPDVCCGGKFPIITELAEISPMENGLPWEAFYPGIDTTLYNPYCLAEEIPAGATAAGQKAAVGVSKIGDHKIKAAIEGLANGDSLTAIKDAINNAQPEPPEPPPPIPSN